MDVFGAALEARAFLCDAALAAGHELGVFKALARGGPASLEELAIRIGVVAGHHRLRALLDVLAALGAIRCDRWGAPAIAGAAPGSVAAPAFAAAAAALPRPVVARAGWGLIADVIRDDRPLPAGTGDAEATRRLHHHLASAGAAAAQELARSLGAALLLDLGSGAGAYSKAFLEANPVGRATLVDTREVLALAADWLGPLASRARLVEGDASMVTAGDGHGAVLLANLLHLHSPAMCARLCAAAARAVSPGGVVVIKDLRVDDDRAGPIEGLLFALNMAIYTDAGDVYPTSQLRAWLAEAGLIDIVERRLAAAPDAIVVTGRRPNDPAATGAGTATRERTESNAAGANLEPRAIPRNRVRAMLPVSVSAQLRSRMRVGASVRPRAIPRNRVQAVPRVSVPGQLRNRVQVGASVTPRTIPRNRVRATVRVSARVPLRSRVLTVLTAGLRAIPRNRVQARRWGSARVPPWSRVRVVLIAGLRAIPRNRVRATVRVSARMPP